MTISSASRRWVAVASGAITTGAVAAALVLLAAPASAHTPTVTPGCDEGHATLSVVLASYDPTKSNHVKITDGQTVLVDTDFKSNFNYPADVKNPQTLAGDVAHHFVVDVKAWDDPDGVKHFTFSKELDTKPCVTKTTTSSSSSSSSSPSHSSSTPPTTTTTTTPVAVGANANLASTGASIGVPLAIGALLLVAGGGALLFVRKRSRI